MSTSGSVMQTYSLQICNLLLALLLLLTFLISIVEYHAHRAAMQMPKLTVNKEGSR